MNDSPNPVFHALGESALVITWGNTISREWNAKVSALSKALQQKRFEGLTDIIPAYSSLTVLFNAITVRNTKGKAATAYDWVKQYLVVLLRDLDEHPASENFVIEIPVCYDAALQNDLAIISETMSIPEEEIIALHTGKNYHVYMPGFLPGFAYMAEVDKRIAIQRKPTPVQVRPGAVGIAGIQTGIYPVASPGGWHIVGYTPMQLFDAGNATDPCLLHAGDTVQFVAICIDDYHKLMKEKTA